MDYVPEQKNKSIFLTYLIYFISMTLFCVLRILSSEGWLGDLGNATTINVVYTILIQIGLMFVLPLILYCTFVRVKAKSVFKTCNFVSTNWTVVLISLALGILAFVLNIVVSTLFSGILSFTGYQTPLVFGSATDIESMTVGSFFLDLLLTACLPAFCEEFMHRGILLQGTKHSGFKKSIIISGILFGLIHFNINQVAYAMVLGMFMGLVSVVAKNIWPAIIIHFTNNAISVYLEYAEVKGWFGGGIYNSLNSFMSNANGLIIFLIVAAVLIVLAVLIILLIMQLFKQSILRKVNKAIDTVYSSDDLEVKNSPVTIYKGKMIQTMLENNTMLNLDYEAMKSPLDIIMPKQKHLYKMSYRDKIFMYSSFLLGILVTFFTYLWGFI